MKTILFLSYDLPYPLDAGGKIRVYHLIHQLSKRYHIRLLYFYRGKQKISHEKKLSKYCTKIIACKRRPVASLVTIRYMSQMPFPAALYFDKNTDRKIEKELADGVDILHAESFYTSVYLKKRKTLQILGTENIEWRVYKDYANQEKSRIMKLFFEFEIQRIKRYEIKSWQLPDTIFAVSEENQLEIINETLVPVRLVKNGVDSDYFSAVRHKSDSRTILFVGNFNYIQNIDSAEYLLQEIAPLLPKEYTVRLVGRNPSSEIVNLVKKSQKEFECTILLDADIDDIRDAFSDTFALIAPLRAGSGTKFKILEAMASGVPVITTDIGAEGIDIKKGENILIANSPREFVSSIYELSNNPDGYRKLSKNARSLVLTKYSWDAIGKNLLNIYEKTIDNNR